MASGSWLRALISGPWLVTRVLSQEPALAGRRVDRVGDLHDLIALDLIEGRLAGGRVELVGVDPATAWDGTLHVDVGLLDRLDDPGAIIGVGPAERVDDHHRQTPALDRPLTDLLDLRRIGLNVLH